MRVDPVYDVAKIMSLDEIGQLLMISWQFGEAVGDE